MDIELAGGPVPLDVWRRVCRDGAAARLSARGMAAVERSAALIGGIVARGEPVYGVNTGFGKLAGIRIDDGQLERLQRNLVLSHTVGVGEPLPPAVVRLVMAMKIASFGPGASGVRREVVVLLQEMLARGVLPVIPAQGSVGASGDLAPLAHLSAVMIGCGRARLGDAELPGAVALERAGLGPVVLGPKEGLALLNGTQVSTALALTALFDIEELFSTAIVTGALATEAGLGSVVPFDQRIQALRPHRGQVRAAALLRELLSGGGFRALQAKQGRLQDPYCLRCQPQVMGACLDVMRFASELLATEASGVSDNPLILPDSGEIVSGGNFHAEPVAFAADMLANAVAEIGGMAERRVAFLVDAGMSGLPPFLTTGGGLSSGFMSLQIAAAALVAENRQKSHPASVDSVPTVGNQEDFVSMATHGARRLHDMVANARAIVATELLAAVQGMELRGDLRSSDRLERVRRLVRAEVPSMAEDWEFSAAVQAANRMVGSGAVCRTAEVSVLNDLRPPG